MGGPDSEEARAPARPPEAAAASEPVVSLPLAALTAGARHVQPLPPGRTRRYELALQAGQYLHLVVEQLRVDVAATVRDPAGRPLLRVDSPNDDRGPEDVFLLAGATGRHVLELAAGEGAGDGGRYEIRVEALRPATEEDRRYAAAAAAYSRGRLLEKEGLAETAAASYREAAELWAAVGEESRQAWALYRLGRMRYQQPAHRAEGIEALSRALELFRRVGDEPQQAHVLFHLGRAWMWGNEAERAARCYERAAALWEELEDPYQQASRINDVAIARMFQGRFHAAIEQYSQAAEVFRGLGRWKDLATSQTNLGMLYHRLGEHRMALHQYRRALDLLDRQPDPAQRAATLNKLGDVLLDTEGPDAALEKYREALELRRRQDDLFGQGVTLNGIGLVGLATNRPREALQAFGEALEAFRRHGSRRDQAVALLSLGVAYERLGHPDRARERFERALDLTEGQPWTQEIALFGLARVARAEGRLAEAERWIERALGAVEAVRQNVWRPDLRGSYHARKQEQYAFLIDLLAERHRLEPAGGHDARAFATSESARARSLLDLLSAADESPGPGELRRLDDLSRRINARHLDLLTIASRDMAGGLEGDLQGELTGLLESFRQTEAAAQGASLARALPPLVSLEQVQARLLDDDTLLLEVFLGEERSFLWAVTPTAARFVTTLPGRAEIEEAARQVSLRMAESHYQTGELPARRAAARLSRMLLGPVSDLLDRPRLVFVVPGALQAVPFAALPHPEAGAASPARPLIADHEIVSLPSASVLAALRAKRAGRKPPAGLLAVLADPVFEPGDARLQGLSAAGEPSRPPYLPRLRYTRREAEEILALAGPELTLAAFGFEASRKLVLGGRLSRYRILHFATHGLLNDRYPELSALALSAFDASGRRVDGHLRAYEVSSLDLRADLVVLSACRTGLGRDVRGEGLVGLTQAFLQAGASRLVVSFWDVDDRATGELMRRFYEALLVDKLPPAQALRQAQLSLWREEGWRAPYHWAGFTFQGEWR